MISYNTWLLFEKMSKYERINSENEVKKSNWKMEKCEKIMIIGAQYKTNWEFTLKRKCRMGSGIVE